MALLRDALKPNNTSLADCEKCFLPQMSLLVTIREDWMVSQGSYYTETLLNREVIVEDGTLENNLLSQRKEN